MSEKPWLKAFEEEVARLRPLWQANYDDKIELSPRYPTEPPKWWFNKWAEEYPGKPYVMQGETVITYGLANDIARRLANALTSLGVKKGDRVAIISPNLPQYVLSIQALLKIGAIEVPTNPLYTVREISIQVKDSGAETIIVMAMFAEKAIEVMKEPDSPVKRIIVFQVPTMPVEVEKGDTIYDFNEIIAAADNTEPDTELTPDDIVRLQYTGGTTGVPKGCVLTNHNVMSKAVRIGQWVTNNYTTMKAGDIRALSIIPISHIFGFMAAVGFNFVCGGSLVTVPVPDPDAIFDAIERYKPATLPAVPTLLILLMNHPRFQQTDFSCFRGGIFCGGSALPEEIIRQFEEKCKCRIVEGYGMSESCQQITSNSAHHTRKIGSVGVPWVDTDVLVVDSVNGVEIMPPGQPGEIIFRGPQLMREYWNNPEETAKAMRDGWFYTGDIGYMDEDGFFYIVDRKKDIIVSSGFNVYPREIDEVCYAMPEVQDACTVGIPHAKRGEVAKTFIVLKPGAKLSEEEVIARCREKLAPYKVPKEVEFLSDLPRTPVGKPDRKSLKAMVAGQQV